MTEPFNRYDLTSARQHGRPGRDIRPKSLTVDIHSHAMVPAAVEVVRGHLHPDPRATFYTEETRVLGRKQDADRTPYLKDLELRLRTFDDMGVDAQVITPAPGQCYYSVPAEVGIKAARVINEGMAEIAHSCPDRIPAAMGSVPLQAGGEAAASELEYCVKSLGLKGVEVLAHVRDKELSDPTFEPFWAKVEELGAVVFIHPNSYPQPQRFRDHYFSNVIGNPLDTTMALHWLIFDGVLERYPDLKIIASHGGGYLPALFRAHRSCVGRAQQLARDIAEAAELLSEENLPRHDRFHSASIGGDGEVVRRGQDSVGHRLPVRHGRI